MLKNKIITLLFFINYTFSCNQSFADEINDKIKNFILKNPQIIIESLNNFEKEKDNERRVENKQKIQKFNDLIFKSNTSIYEGQVSAKKTIVEFFDYNCSYCKRAHKDIKAVLKKSGDVKIIYKNFPILSENSVKLAKYAIILSEMDNKKFIDFHNIIISHKGQIKEEDLEKIFKKLNILKSEIDLKLNDENVLKSLENDINLSKKLGLRGTPAFIINDEIIFGYINFEEMLSKLN